MFHHDGNHGAPHGAACSGNLAVTPSAGASMEKCAARWFLFVQLMHQAKNKTAKLA
jgi:hypothetical protein